jgi:hypothetical protein
MKIATQHICSHEIQEKHIQSGKISRIQEGYLLRLYNVPRTKYDGVFIVIGPCSIQKYNDTQYQLIGINVEQFIERWYQNIIHTTCKNFAPNCKIQYQKNRLAVKTNETRWFAYKQYNKSYELFSDEKINLQEHGIAVISTKGPWFHVSKTYMTCNFSLVEFVVI